MMDDMDRKSHARTVCCMMQTPCIHAHGWSHHIGVFGIVEEGIVSTPIRRIAAALGQVAEALVLVHVT
jgi:hypothetical protein